MDLEQLSRGTPGFSGADLFNLMNQAALKSSVQGLKQISMASLEFAKDKIMMGAERQSAIISEETIKWCVCEKLSTRVSLISLFVL